MVVFGVALFGVHAMREDDRRLPIARRYVRVVCGAAVLGIGLSLASMVVMAKAMTGASAYAELTAHVFSMIVTGTAVGVALVMRAVALLAGLAAIVALSTRPLPPLSVPSAFGAVALATLAWAGHGAMDDGMRGAFHLVIDIAHLLAAGAWVGALVAFVMLASAARGASPEAVDLFGRASNGFARIGTLIVATLAVTGVVNYFLIAGPTLDGVLSQ